MVDSGRDGEPLLAGMDVELSMVSEDTAVVPRRDEGCVIPVDDGGNIFVVAFIDDLEDEVFDEVVKEVTSVSASDGGGASAKLKVRAHVRALGITIFVREVIIFRSKPIVYASAS